MTVQPSPEPSASRLKREAVVAYPASAPLSDSWMANIGSLILIWVSLAPLAWIGSRLFITKRLAEAVALVVIGLLVLCWNVKLLRKILFGFYQESGPRPYFQPKRWQLFMLFGVQLGAALLCTSLAEAYNPIGMQQWFWLPISAFAGLLLTVRSQIALVLLVSLVVSTLQQYLRHGLNPAMLWMLGQLTPSVFIMACVFGVAQAARQRLVSLLTAADLRVVNLELELQADQVAVLAVEQERIRLAREIHDAVGHSLTVIGAQLEAAEALMKQAPDRALDAIRKAQHAGREGLAEIRRSVSALRAAPLDERPLAELLLDLVTAVGLPDLSVSFQQSGKSRPLPSLLESSLYRCAQEGITNAYRHANPSKISVLLDYSSKGSASLTVTDDGCGFSKISTSQHGLKGLYERATLLHGQFTAGTGPQGGGVCRMLLPT